MATSWERFRRTLDVVEAGDNAAVLLRGVRRDAVRLGDTVELTVSLGRAVALEPGLGFAVREGNRTVAAGRVEALLD